MHASLPFFFKCIYVIVKQTSACVHFQASPGTIANPFATGIVRKNSMESISSIDRDLSPEEIDIMQKVQYDNTQL